MGWWCGHGTGAAERRGGTRCGYADGGAGRRNCEQTVAADKAYDTKDLVAVMRELNVTPHVTQNEKRPGGSAIDGRTTRHAGYQLSQRKRKRIEEVFGWMKTVGMLRKTRHRGIFKNWRVGSLHLRPLAYNLVRMRNLLFPATSVHRRRTGESVA